MTASEHLSPGQFFHGSGNAYQPGDELNEEGARQAGGGGRVWLTPNHRVAAHYARLNAMGRREYFGDGEARPHVYEVQPHELHQHETGYTTSRATVVREVPYERPRGLPDDWDEYTKQVSPRVLGD